MGIIEDYENIMPIKKISQKYDISISTLYKLLNQHGVVRGISKSDTQRFIRKHKISKNTLYNLYVTEEKTIKLISEELNKSPHTIRRLLHAYDIKTRSLSEHLSIKKYKNAHSKKMSSILLTKSDELSKRSKAMWEKWNNKQHPNLITKMNSEEYKNNMRIMMLKRHKTEWHNIYICRTCGVH